MFLMNQLCSQELRVSMDYGYAIAEMKDLKKIMLQTGIKAGVEFRLEKNYVLVISTGGSLLQHSYSGGSIFNRKYFLTIPVSIKRYYPFSKRSAGFVDAGIYAANGFLDKKEIRSMGSTLIDKHRDLGWNGGLVLCFGFKTMITPSVSVDIGLQGQKDLISSYKLEENKIKTERTSLVISFYKNLGR